MRNQKINPFFRFRKLQQFFSQLLSFLTPVFLYRFIGIAVLNSPSVSLSEIFDLVLVGILALWSFLREPFVLICKRKMEELSIQYPELQNQILQWSSGLAIKRMPRLFRIPANTVEDILVWYLEI